MIIIRDVCLQHVASTVNWLSTKFVLSCHKCIRDRLILDLSPFMYCSNGVTGPRIQRWVTNTIQFLCFRNRSLDPWWVAPNIESLSLEGGISLNMKYSCHETPVFVCTHCYASWGRISTKMRNLWSAKKWVYLQRSTKWNAKKSLEGPGKSV